MYEFTAFYLYKAIFMVELLVAEVLMCVGMKRRPQFALRFFLCCAVCIGIAFAIPVVAYNALYCSFVFLFMFVVTLPAIAVCWEGNTTAVFFRGVAAYTTQHIAYQLFDLAMTLIGLLLAGDAFDGVGAYGDEMMSDYLPIIMYRAGSASLLSESPLRAELYTLFGYFSYAMIYIGVYTVCYLFAHKRLKDSDKFELKISSMFVFATLFVLFNIVISSVVIYAGGKDISVFSGVLLSVYNVVCCLLTMYLMFEVVFKKQFERDYNAANRLLRQAGEQYRLAQENIELINLKCHDLKHQIRTIGSQTGGGKAIAEIEDMISIYDANIHTGNEALDTILTEKSLYCNKRAIKLYCIVNGGLLDFMSEADLYSLFGNILDNAIEAVEQLPAEERFINLGVTSVNGFIRITESNRFSGKLDFDNGIPDTTKADKENHGYGLKSIRLICRKYDAEFSVRAEAGLFELGIVFLK